MKLPSLLSGVFGSSVKPLVNGLKEVALSKEVTKRSVTAGRIMLEFAAASWRPWMARLVGWTVLIYVLASTLLMLVNLRGITTGTAWADSEAMDKLWGRWLDFGWSVLKYGMAFIGTYVAGRSGEKAVERYSGRGLRERLRKKPSGVERESTVSRPSQKIERVQGVRVPKRSEEALDETVQINAVVSDAHYPSHGYAYGKSSLQKLGLAHEALQSLFHWLIERSPYDIGISQTERSYEEQLENYRNRDSLTMDSRHLERPAMAVDFFIYIGKQAVWDIELYAEVVELIKQGAAELGVPIRAGIDFRDADGNPWPDGGHIELSRKSYPKRPPAA